MLIAATASTMYKFCTSTSSGHTGVPPVISLAQHLDWNLSCTTRIIRMCLLFQWKLTCWSCWNYFLAKQHQCEITLNSADAAKPLLVTTQDKMLIKTKFPHKKKGVFSKNIKLFLIFINMKCVQISFILQLNRFLITM